jgi:hypothetical protein
LRAFTPPAFGKHRAITAKRHARRALNGVVLPTAHQPSLSRRSLPAHRTGGAIGIDGVELGTSAR